MKTICATAVVAAVLALSLPCAQAQTTEEKPPEVAKKAKRRVLPTIESAPVVEVLRVDEEGFRFVAYVVLWNGRRVVIADPLAETEYQVGDAISFAVIRHRVGGKGVLGFLATGDRDCRPKEPAAGQGAAATSSDSPCAESQVPFDPQPASERSSEGAAADQVLRKMTEAYASMQSYTDRGVVTVRLEDSDETIIETTFETAFARPNLFRFDWTNHHPANRDVDWRSVVWSDGTATYTHSETDSEPETMEEESLELAIAGATGVSSGSARTIPRLLMPEIGGWSLSQLQSPTVVGVETIDGVPCHRVRGQHPRLEQIDVWIGVQDHLVRKVALLGSEEVRQDIRVDVQLPKETFSLEGRPTQSGGSREVLQADTVER